MDERIVLDLTNFLSVLLHERVQAESPGQLGPGEDRVKAFRVEVVPGQGNLRLGKTLLKAAGDGMREASVIRVTHHEQRFHVL